MAQLFYDENDPRKKREMKGDKTPIDICLLYTSDAADD